MIKDIIEKELEKELMFLVGNLRRNKQLEPTIRQVYQQKKWLFEERDVQIVKGEVMCEVLKIESTPGGKEVDCQLYYEFLVREQERFYIEEKIENRRIFVGDDEKVRYGIQVVPELPYAPPISIGEEGREEKGYSGLAAAKYAEAWWNGTNPRYQRFTNDCTNFISQCLFAGGMKMRGYGQVQQGWWYGGSRYSYSWTVANSLLYYLVGSKTGIRGKRVHSAKELRIGDLIFYDFEGDGRFDHSTIVVNKDESGQPLVNAHTQDSRNRFWSYEDSSRYTENMQYRFISIIDG